MMCNKTVMSSKYPGLFGHYLTLNIFRNIFLTADMPRYRALILAERKIAW